MSDHAIPSINKSIYILLRCKLVSWWVPLNIAGVVQVLHPKDGVVVGQADVEGGCSVFLLGRQGPLRQVVPVANPGWTEI